MGICELQTGTCFLPSSPARSDHQHSLMCPKCGSAHLKIKQVKGFERILLLWTGKRKYRCKNCFFSFRQTDRRALPRENIAPAPPPLGRTLPADVPREPEFPEKM